MFTPESRDRVRSELLEYAAKDNRISSAAITGSATTMHEDRWSDVDLAFGVVDEAQLVDVLSDFTEHVYEGHSAVHHFDIRSGPWIYRVFLLANTLQVDIAFVASTEFRALAPTFRIVFGEAQESKHLPPPQLVYLIGMGWLYALHARSSIARNHLWQAEFMISGVRDNALALACIRLGLPAVHGRGFDLLPREVTDQFEGSLVQELNRDKLSCAFRTVVQGFLNELECADVELARRLQAALMHMTESLS
jgi:hypothetical protein